MDMYYKGDLLVARHSVAWVMHAGKAESFAITQFTRLDASDLPVQF